jgi:hypothetical protein
MLLHGLHDELLEKIVEEALFSLLLKVETFSQTQHLWAVLPSSHCLARMHKVLFTRTATQRWMNGVKEGTMLEQIVRRGMGGREAGAALVRIASGKMGTAASDILSTVQRLIGMCSIMRELPSFAGLSTPTTVGFPLACMATYVLPVLLELYDHGIREFTCGTVFAPMNNKQLWVRVTRHGSIPVGVVRTASALGVGIPSNAVLYLPIDLLDCCWKRWHAYCNTPPDSRMNKSHTELSRSPKRRRTGVL